MKEQCKSIFQIALLKLYNSRLQIEVSGFEMLNVLFTLKISGPNLIYCELIENVKGMLYV